MHDPAEYGNEFADVYDEMHPLPADDAVERMAGLVRPGARVLELGIGTGRLALPLAARGFDVHGVDASPAMIERLRAKPGGLAIPVSVRDFADCSGLAGAPFALAWCAFNTFFALLTQEDQLRCFRTVADALEPGGHFVVEAFVPDSSRFTQPQPVLLMGAKKKTVFLEASTHDAARQRVSTRIVRVRDEGLRVMPIEIRYAYPSELDLMARLAGLRLAHRWSSWRGAPFGAGSAGHVSAWRKPADGDDAQA